MRGLVPGMCLSGMCVSGTCPSCAVAKGAVGPPCGLWLQAPGPLLGLMGVASWSWDLKEAGGGMREEEQLAALWEEERKAENQGSEEAPSPNSQADACLRFA